MITQASGYEEQVIHSSSLTISPPSCLLEYGFYLYLVYVLMGGVFGLFVNNLASGLLVLLLILCLSEAGYQAITLLRTLAFPIGCGVAIVFIQLFFFEESITETVRPFLIWMVVLFLIQSLTLRVRFLHRFVLVMLFIGLAALPYLSFYEADTKGGAMKRAVLDRTIGFSQTNEMGAWYGFCAVYFMVLGSAAKTHLARTLSWLVAVGCSYTVTLTVSRGALLAVVVAIVVSSRHLLKAGFLPILLLASLAAIVIGLGIFEETTYFYAARGAEDTGRLAVWPLIIDSFLNSPWIGVGSSHVGATPIGRHAVTPHNGFLQIAQSSGIVPLGFFIAYWLRSASACLRSDTARSPDATFYLPLMVYTFIVTNLSAFAFMTPWAIVSLAIPMTDVLRRHTSDISGQ
jgi:O-antigen ligase